MFSPSTNFLRDGRASGPFRLAAVVHEEIPCARIGFLASQFPKGDPVLGRSGFLLSIVAELTTEIGELRL